MTKQNGVPAGLGKSGRALWLSVVGPFELDVHEELLLVQACRCVDRLDRLEAEAAKGPTTVVNFRGDPVAHPALVESRLQAMTLSRLLAALRMPSGETGQRPQRRGGARVPYGVRSIS